MGKKLSYKELEQKIVELENRIDKSIQSKQALKENEKKIHGLFNGMSSGVVFCEAIYGKNRNMVDCIFRDMNTVYENFTNLKKEKAIGHKVSEMLPGTEAEWFSKFGEVVRSGNPVSFDMYHENSNKHYSVFAYCADKNEFAAIFDDITIQKKAEETLKDSEEKYRLLTETMKDVVIRISPSGKLLYISPAISNFGGYRPENEIGKNISRYFSKKPDLHRALELFNEVTITHESGKYNFLFKPKNKDPFHVEYTFVPLMDSGKVIAIHIVLRDISERKREEEIMLKASRMEATATLAAGIAHDFNNLMVGVLGNADLLKIQFEGEPEISARLNTIGSSARKAADLAQQLLAFAKGGKYQPKVINLNEIIQETLRLNKNSFPNQILIEKNLEPDLLSIKADPAQMNQVVMNLCVNSVEAIDGAGKIIINTGNINIEENPDLLHPSLTIGSYVYLSIEDTGSGMDKKTLSKIFEPFFSTKFTGRGLGLASAHGIIENHDGNIFVNSEVDKGTTFKVFLPAVEFEVLSEPEIKKTIHRGTETILIIDDEPLVLDIAKSFLKAYGYNVLLANNGQEGVNIAQSFDGNIHLALLDMGMPVLSGKEAFPLLKKARPEIKIIICSGYELDENARSVLDAGANLFIQKPFRLEDLIHKVRKTLDATEVYGIL